MAMRSDRPAARGPFGRHLGQSDTSGTDRNPGSVVRRLAEAFARELAALSEQLDAVYESAFVETDSGEALDHVARLLGVRRTDQIKKRPPRWLGSLSVAVVLIAAWWIARRRRGRC